jgi:hypothetical protein
MNISESLFDAWIAKVQTELGVITTNNLLLEITNKSLEQENINHLELIEALKVRILATEKANQELKESIQVKRKK